MRLNRCYGGKSGFTTQIREVCHRRDCWTSLGSGIQPPPLLAEPRPWPLLHCCDGPSPVTSIFSPLSPDGGERYRDTSESPLGQEQSSYKDSIALQPDRMESDQSIFE
jgi:hypothetical protein